MKHPAIVATLGLTLALLGCRAAPQETYSVFFEPWSSKLDQQSDTLIKAAAVYAADHPAEPFADTKVVPAGMVSATCTVAAAACPRFWTWIV